MEISVNNELGIQNPRLICFTFFTDIFYMGVYIKVYQTDLTLTHNIIKINYLCVQPKKKNQYSYFFGTT